MRDQKDVTDSTLWLLNSKSFLPIIALLGLFLYLSASNTDPGRRIDPDIILFYMVIPLFFIGYWNVTIDEIQSVVPKYRGNTGKIESWLKMPHNTLLIQTIYFIIFFGMIGGLIFLAEHYTALQADSVLQPYWFGTLAFHLLLVAPSESIVFHAVIPLKIRQFLDKKRIPNYQKVIIRYGLSQAIFSLSHIFVFGSSGFALIWAFGWGIVFLLLAETFGLSATIGAHFGVNGVLSGALAWGGVRTGTLSIGHIYLTLPVIIIIISYSIIKIINSYSMRNDNRWCKKWLRVQLGRKPIKQLQ